MIERKWPAVPARPFTANGGATGIVKIADTAGFYTKQEVIVVATGLPPLLLQVQEVADPTTLWVGPAGAKVGRQYFTNISAYTVAAAASIFAGEQDRKSNPPTDDHYNAIYAGDPIVADRVINVDKYGRYYDLNNPLPVVQGGSELKPPQFDEVNIVRTCAGQMTSAEYKLAGVVVRTLTFTYSCCGELINVKAT